uniref:Sulfide:quinone oxidoreductase n=1 Tax=Candidatus Kentrum sp. FM TaxID=2126340 RepID=A0A450WQ40_9GAMM|nr:MAG: sulfide:quinone oxidoreductase [Candidatus Kentron sp. FM]VFJ59849.1 MAG: sulfide:quinone oxidoreductase [Candidatus Kentron sp. FM]VFK19130.1 MAG: sulfide:quinone oxidoreductase [Candidatus Kentron sp. FM]
MAKRVTVIGSGFAALTAIRTLRARDKDLKITVVAPKPEFVFLPSLIWIPSGLRTVADVVVRLDRFFHRMDVTYHPGAAVGIENGGRKLRTDAGVIENDGLIIACGSRYIKKLPGIEQTIIPCEGIPPARDLQTRLAGMTKGAIAFGFSGNPKEPPAVRGGPMFEFLFGIDTQLTRENRRDKFKLAFFNPMKDPGQRLGPRAVAGLKSTMAKRGIEMHLGHKMKGFEPGKVITEGGEIEADLILFLPGMTGLAWYADAGLPLSPGGFVQADTNCRVLNHERVYVAGDAGSYPVPDWLPKQGHMADLQAAAAAENLIAELGGQEPAKTFQTELLCIIDDLRAGIMVARTQKHNVMLPPLRAMHWSKIFFEKWYLRKYR